MKRFRALALAASLAPLAFACGSATPAARPPQPQPQPTVAATAPPPAPVQPSVDEAVLDKSVSPCDDFYQYACGGWRKVTPIPDDQSRWVRSFSVLREKNEETLRDILEAMASGKDADAPYAKPLGDFYASCMDESAIEAKGIAPLEPELARIDAVKTPEALAKELAHLHLVGVNALFASGSEQDAKDSSLMIGAIVQAGLGLPDRDYYVEPKRADAKAKYQAYIETLFTLLGEKPELAKTHAATVMAIEQKLAEASMTRIDRRDPKKTYNRLERKGLKDKAPAFMWDAYFAELGTPDLAAINVRQPDFMKAASDLVRTTPMADIRTYLRAHVARKAAPALGSKFVEAAFVLQQALSGTKVIEPRWKRCVRAVDAGMGEALGQTFVKTALGAEGKAQVTRMVDELQASMGHEISIVPWMDDATRAAAKEKLSLFTKKIGYPDKWRDYSKLAIDRGSYLANRFAADDFESHRELAKIGKPVDRSEWLMTPPTINAYYLKDNNEIVFPAGILQEPFFSTSMPRAMAYGAIGAVMGHEITHGFDDKGRQYDGHGDLRDWWSPSVNAEFEKRAACVEHEYDGFVPIDDLHLKGKLTLGENIADLGGLKIAYAALKAAEAKAPSTARYAYTDDQQFFLGFAQVWCENVRDEEARQRVAVDPHSPSRFRVNGTMVNIPEFAAAFSCGKASAMVRPPAERCDVW